MEENLLDNQLFENSNLRRRDLLPTWIKVFLWLFLILGAIVPLVWVFSFFGIQGNLSIYGLTTYQPLSIIGVVVTILFLFKGVVAFGLWFEKEWAVKFAITDAIIGAIVCVFVMAILPFIGSGNGMNFNLRLELIPIYFYYNKMIEIKDEWTVRMAKS